MDDMQTLAPIEQIFKGQAELVQRLQHFLCGVETNLTVGARFEPDGPASGQKL